MHTCISNDAVQFVVINWVVVIFDRSRYRKKSVPWPHGMFMLFQYGPVYVLSNCNIFIRRKLSRGTSSNRFHFSAIHWLINLPQWINDGSVTIDSDGCKCENRNIHTYSLNEWQEWAHEMWQIPTLQNGCLELKFDIKNAINYIEWKTNRREIFRKVLKFLSVMNGIFYVVGK